MKKSQAAIQWHKMVSCSNCLMRCHLMPLACVLLMGGLQSARAACDCATRLSPGEAYERATGVFVGVVKRIEPTSTKDQAGERDQASQKEQSGQKDQTGSDSVNAEQQAYFQVEKAYKGGKEGEIVLHQPNDGCSPQFLAGRRWLLYAIYQEGSQSWVVTGCSRSRGIEFAADDLLYLDSLPRSATQTRISGLVSQYEQSPETGFSLIKNVPGVKVKITGGDKAYEATTEKNGVYEIYGLLPGRYTIQAVPPPGLRVRFPIPFGPAGLPESDCVTLELKPNGSTGCDFVVSSDSSITGRVLDPTGAPIANICVDLVPSKGPPNRPFRIDDCTNQDGRYQLRQVPPGDYLIVVNKGKKPSASEPYPRSFYPGVLIRDRATVVTMSLGGNLEGYDIRIPRKLPLIILQGVLVYSDGKPVAREQVSFRADPNNPNPGIERNASTFSDDQGRFTLPIIQGSTGTLVGGIYISETQFPDCPEVRKLLDAEQRGSIEAKTEPLRIDASADNRNIRLMLPFGGCEKK